MAWLKVQDDSVGLATPSAPISSSTATVNLVQASVAGNLLVCSVTVSSNSLGGSAETPTIQTPTAPGFTWTLVADSGASPPETTGGQTAIARCAVFYITNAGAMGTGVTTSVTCTTPSNVTTALDVEISLYEFSGEAVSSAIDTSGTGTGLSSSPTAGSLTANFTDLLFVAGALSTPNVTAGSGFTITTATSNVDQEITGAEYKLNAAASSYTAAFTYGLSGTWACVGVAFKPLGAGGGGGTGFPSGADTQAIIAEHNPTAFGTTGDGGGGGSSDGGATGCGSCPGPHLLELIPGFSDIPDSVLEADDPAFALHLGEIAMNATFGMVRLEVFPCLQKHGDVIPLPSSCWDGYKYSREELNYFWTIQNTTDPSTRWISGPDSMWFSNWNVNQETGEVFSEEWYERSSAADTRLAAKSNDGSLMVFTIGQRQKTNVIVATPPAYVNINEGLIATDKPYTQDLLRNLSNNAKFSWINTEFFYLGTFVDGNTVPPPVSQADGYHYSYAECKFLHAWRWTANGGDYTQPPGQYEQAAPFQASISTSGVVSVTVTFITNGGEDVIPAPSYGRIAAFAFCTRSATPSSGTLANSFTELALDFFAPGTTVRASELLTIKRNIDEAILSPEFFGPTEYADADVVPLPISTVDNYHYSRAEVQYIWSWSDTTNSAPGNSHVRLPLFFGSVDPVSGIVKLRVYRLPPGGPYLDDNNTFARIKVLVMATRQAIHSELMLGVVHDGSIVTPSDSSTVVKDDSGDLINGN